jgi:Helix-turn-helix domain
MQSRWLPASALAQYIGVHPRTVRDWIAGGVVPAVRVQKQHYTDDRPRKTARGQWRIYETDVDALLLRLRLSGKLRGFPPTWWRRG